MTNGKAKARILNSSSTSVLVLGARTQGGGESCDGGARLDSMCSVQEDNERQSESKKSSAIPSGPSGANCTNRASFSHVGTDPRVYRFLKVGRLPKKAYVRSAASALHCMPQGKDKK